MQTSEISDPSFVLNFPDPEIFEHFSFQLSDRFYSIMQTSEISDPSFVLNFPDSEIFEHFSFQLSDRFHSIKTINNANF